ncbi:restriction endonuclease [Candidatus Wolfebacteria bacterium CG18_big_fil_WC_8_21_14_2_50_39_7]|uniref:Restriction endonuclease n=2 Tax=Candidatus Wolfeibacteriota TaxID=1752735 RepID=A0A2H0ED09_9BACT|nr:MjaI family restriction endonuclease [Candidatus Falkowbacteria bacterium]NCO15493.1 MjaI family restriction endonuclease [Parcubacteria group bacterium]NCP58447.1 MjaI family restriction endonuclease [Candidatus Wolfebacteria bacterium]OIO65107.1 MAG: restriction endonuclease [Candidatus Wolfebacteria bacterium CG1_02_39_135]PIP92343.1 MAG: restriction endonuclease [Candidatus Wolfebacteria bacterium CG18_big_fil_WC_8_21_14_2_50_39_7]
MIKINNQELIKELIGEIKDFPKYTTQIINLANQNAQGTRPRVVGQLSELIQECPEKTYEGWKKWYLEKYPDAIENATQKINEMITNLKEAIKLIDQSLIKKWVEDLVLEKTFIGLRFQEAILKKVASIKNTNYRLSEPKEESQGIDGFIGNEPVSIKPSTYKTKNALREEIKTKIIFYNKTKNGIEIDADEILK